MQQSVLLSKAVSEATGYTDNEALQILLRKMDKSDKAYINGLQANAFNPNSWADVTTCYHSSDPQVYIREVGIKEK